MAGGGGLGFLLAEAVLLRGHHRSGGWVVSRLIHRRVARRRVEREEILAAP